MGNVEMSDGMNRRSAIMAAIGAAVSAVLPWKRARWKHHLLYLNDVSGIPIGAKVPSVSIAIRNGNVVSRHSTWVVVGPAVKRMDGTWLLPVEQCDA